MRACWKPEGPNAVFRQGLTAQAGIISPSPSGRVPGGTHPPTDQKTLPIKKFRRLAGPLASAPQPSKDGFRQDSITDLSSLSAKSVDVSAVRNRHLLAETLQ